MSTPTVLPPLTAVQLVAARPTDPGRTVGAAVSRATLMLLPLAAALAAIEFLAPLPWQVPAAALAAGWCAAAPLTDLGRRTAGQRGPGPAARLVLGGYGALALIGAVGLAGLLVVTGTAAAEAPAALTGAGLARSAAAGGVALALFAVLSVASATGTETMLVRWSAPAVVVTGAILAGWLPLGGPAAAAAGEPSVAETLPAVPGGTLPVPGEPLLAAAVALALARTVTLARRPATADRAPADRYAAPRVAAWLLLGAAQVAAVVTAWRVGVVPVGDAPATAGAPIPATVAPVLLALPLIEVWAGRRHATRIRRPVAVTVLALPLLTAAALAAAAGQLPTGSGVSTLGGPALLGLAGGALLAGLWAAAALLGAYQRPWHAAGLVGAPVLVTLALVAAAPLLADGWPQWGQPLPAFTLGCAVAALAALAGLATAAARHTVAARRPRRAPTVREEPYP